MIRTEDIRIRDPFVLVDNDIYYLYGTTDENAWDGQPDGFMAYRSLDLKQWEGPFRVFSHKGFWATKQYWAPEVHLYNGKYYMFASFKSEDRCRGTQILMSDEPLGTFQPISDYPITPNNWECLDGTLWIEKGKPYIIFCHEWLQIEDGSICAMELSSDLKNAVGEPIKLFNASEAPWTGSFRHKDMKNCFVTDGPFIIKEKDKLIMIWSSYDKNHNYAIGQSESDSLLGKWIHSTQTVFDKDGGHGMIFKTLNGQNMLSMHFPNKTPYERAKFFELTLHNGKLVLKQ